jgi:hypothetical protein
MALHLLFLEISPELSRQLKTLIALSIVFSSQAVVFSSDSWSAFFNRSSLVTMVSMGIRSEQ